MPEYSGGVNDPIASAQPIFNTIEYQGSNTNNAGLMPVVNISPEETALRPLESPEEYKEAALSSLQQREYWLAQQVKEGLDPTGQTAAGLDVDKALVEAYLIHGVNPWTNSNDPNYIAAQNDPAVKAARDRKAELDAKEAQRLADYYNLTPAEYVAKYGTGLVGG